MTWKHQTCLYFGATFDSLTLLVTCSVINQRKSEQLYPVLKQFGLAGEQAGKTRVFFRYNHHYHSDCTVHSVNEKLLKTKADKNSLP